jgi:hypothetical protein
METLRRQFFIGRPSFAKFQKTASRNMAETSSLLKPAFTTKAITAASNSFIRSAVGGKCPLFIGSFL